MSYLVSPIKCDKCGNERAKLFRQNTKIVCEECYEVNFELYQNLASELKWAKEELADLKTRDANKIIADQKKKLFNQQEEINMDKQRIANLLKDVQRQLRRINKLEAINMDLRSKLKK